MAEQTNKINCSMCLNEFVEPKTVECGHEFCVKCLEEYVNKVGKDNRFPCPLCRRDVTIPVGGIKSFPSSSSGVNMENESIHSPTPNCDPCKRKTKSKFHCLDCKKCFCLSCKTTHDFFFSDHHVSDLDHSRNTVGGSQPFCNRHTTKNLELYCKDCCQIICKECLISDHKDHDTPELNLYGKEAMTELKTFKTEFEKKMAVLTNYVDDVNKKISAINTSADTSCAQIDQQVKTICEAVTRRGCKFKADVQNARQKEERKMKRIVVSSKKFIDELEEYVHNINTILNGDSMYDVLDVLPTIRIQQGENEARELTNLYDVTSEFHLGVIDISTLDQMIGRIEITRNVTITHNFKHSEVTNGDRFSPAYKVDDKLWHFKAFAGSASSYLKLGMMVYGENLASGKTQVTMKLINNKDVLNSIVNTQTLFTGSLTKELTWDTGVSSRSYVINDQFTVQTTIIIVTDIKT